MSVSRRAFFFEAFDGLSVERAMPTRVERYFLTIVYFELFLGADGFSR